MCVCVCVCGGGGWGGNSNIKEVGCSSSRLGRKFQILVSLRVLRDEMQQFFANFRFWSRLGCYAMKCSNFFKNLVLFWGQNMREPRPDWSPLGVNFKILDEHPHLFYIRVPPPPPKKKKKKLGLDNEKALGLKNGYIVYLQPVLIALEAFYRC